MRAVLTLMLFGLGCGAPEPATPNRPFPPAPTPVAVAAVEPDPDPGAGAGSGSGSGSGSGFEPDPVGAMPVPPEEPLAGDTFFDNPSIEMMDTTVRDGDLPRDDLRWKKRVKIKGEAAIVMIVLRIDRWNDGGIYLSIVEDGTGIREQYKLGESDDTVANPFDGTAFRPWGELYQTDPRGDSILFAVRIHPRGAKKQHQFVVYTRGEFVLVVQRELGASTWKRTLRLDFPYGTGFRPIGTSDPH